MVTYLTPTASRWSHRWAVVLACATFPLLWVGGLVTTTDAGMAVPDWPNTYGYNLFLYPLSTWLLGPWDQFIEHGHRLLGAVTGLLTIALLVSLFRHDSRTWVKALGAAALILVCAQGALGGARVVFDERTLAMIHGCVGPIFFSLTVVLAVVTSQRWQIGAVGGVSASPSDNSNVTYVFQALAVVTAIVTYLQIVLGASVRHISVDAPPSAFASHLLFHVTVAGVLTLMIIALTWLAWRFFYASAPLGKLATILCSLLLFQVGLGIGTWALKFSAPQWFANHVAQPGYTIEAGGWLQTHIVTAHVAAGSLILAAAAVLAMYSFQLGGTGGLSASAQKFPKASLAKPVAHGMYQQVKKVAV